MHTAERRRRVAMSRRSEIELSRSDGRSTQAAIVAAKRRNGRKEEGRNQEKERRGYLQLQEKECKGKENSEKTERGVVY